MPHSPRKYLVVNDDNAFKVHNNSYKGYPIVYPLVLLHGMFAYKQKKGCKDEEIKEYLVKMQKIVLAAFGTNELLKIKDNDDQKMDLINEELGKINSFTVEKFFILYPTKSCRGIGLALIDKTDGIYPLVFYANDENQENKKDRVLALKATMDCLIKCFSNLMSEINLHIDRNKGWDEEIKKKLMDIYPSKESTFKPNFKRR